MFVITNLPINLSPQLYHHKLTYEKAVLEPYFSVIAQGYKKKQSV